MQDPEKSIKNQNPLNLLQTFTKPSQKASLNIFILKYTDYPSLTQ